MDSSRRQFIKGVAALSAGLPLWQTATSYGRILGANDTIQVGIVGLRIKGAHHIEGLLNVPGVRVAAICDVDSAMVDREKSKLAQNGHTVTTYGDVRQLLDNKDIDAVFIATPNHTHTLIAIWSCQAGKDVYVEKPLSHNVFEGRQLITAAQKYKRIVQHGTQTRSDSAVREVIQYIQEGHIGALQVARGFCYKRRKSIGKVTGPQPIPATVDYDQFCGPAPLEPLMRKSLHYDWHWQWNTGNGDIGNQGIHELDMCRWALGQTSLPKRVLSLGGRFGYDDDGETPNTQISILEYEPAPIVFEVRGLTSQPDSDAMDHYRGTRIGIALECEGGAFVGGSGGGWIYDAAGQKVRQFVGTDWVRKHHLNFFAAMRSRRTEDLTANTVDGHLSCVLLHMANISYRLGRQTDVETVNQVLREHRGSDAIARYHEHLAVHGIDPDKTPTIVGPWLRFDPATERFDSQNAYDPEFFANQWLSRDYRDPYIVPEDV